MRPFATAAVLAFVLCGAGASAFAQSVEVADRSTPGWVFTPTIAIGLTFDDNPVLTGRGDPAPNDLLTHARPGLDLSFNGRHTRFSGAYRGRLARYRTLQEYDSYDQGGDFLVRHQATRRVNVTGRTTFTVSPATDIVEVAGVPFYRAGTRHTVAQVGTNVAVDARTMASGSYQYQSVEFDAADPAIALLLLGGTAHGATLGVRRQVSPRMHVGGDYRHQRAEYGLSEGGFGIQNAEVVLDWRLSPTVDLTAGAGISRLSLPEDGVRTGPGGRVGITKRTTYALFSASASRSFVPAFGFGGSVMNQELAAAVRVPFARRRAYVQGQFSLRGSEPVLEQELGLTHVHVQTTVGYAVMRWARIEAFYSGSFQDTVVVGGRVDRNRIGVQFSTGQPMRIQ
jgi:hypothetical protein